MDSNLKIIQLVQRKPILYSKCNNFAARSIAWKEVADILKTDVNFVKSRWHLLRTRFLEEYSSVLKGNSTPFKYITEMSFLANHINLNAYEMYSKENEYSTGPEFNITQKDLDEDSENDSSTEFIELELDEESQSELAQVPFEGKEEPAASEYIEPIYIEDNSQANEVVESSSYCETKPQGVENQAPSIKSEENKSSLEKSTLAKTPSEKSLLEILSSPPEKSVPEKKTPEKAVPEETKQKDSKRSPKENSAEKVAVTAEKESPKNETAPTVEQIEEKPQLSSEKSAASPKPANFRCEDTIFGELVTATLREMQADKKKAVKREIMNLLFT